MDRNTYDLFDLEAGVPTDAYGLEEAVKDGFLVPPNGVEGVFPPEHAMQLISVLGEVRQRAAV